MTTSQPEIFDVPSEAREMVQMAREFARDVLAPMGRELDALPGEPSEDPRFWDVMKQAHEIGFHRLPFPPAVGGLGQDPLITAVIMEELARGDAGFATTIGGTFALASIGVVGSRELVDEILRPLCEDESGRFLGAGASTEPDAGTDAINWPLHGDPSIGIKMVAESADGGYLLRGSKRFITNGGLARYYLVSALTDPSRGMAGTAVFVVPAESEGLSHGKPENKLGQRCSTQCDLVFDEVRVEEKYRLPLPAPFPDLFRDSVGLAHLEAAAISTGIAQAALDSADAYAGQRVQGGSSIQDHQAVALRLGDMRVKVESARALYRRAGGRVRAGLGAPHHLGTAAKINAADVAVAVTNDATLVAGGYGYMREGGFEKLVRDAKLCQITHGVNDTLRLWLA